MLSFSFLSRPSLPCPPRVRVAAVANCEPCHLRGGLWSILASEVHVHVHDPRSPLSSHLPQLNCKRSPLLFVLSRASSFPGGEGRCDVVPTRSLWKNGWQGAVPRLKLSSPPVHHLRAANRSLTDMSSPDLPLLFLPLTASRRTASHLTRETRHSTAAKQTDWLPHVPRRRDRELAMIQSWLGFWAFIGSTIDHPSTCQHHCSTDG